jgi:hypothetical protein
MERLLAVVVHGMRQPGGKMGFKGVSRKIDEAAIGSSKLLLSPTTTSFASAHSIYIF